MKFNIFLEITIGFILILITQAFIAARLYQRAKRAERLLEIKQNSEELLKTQMANLELKKEYYKYYAEKYLEQYNKLKEEKIKAAKGE
jgi:hypothetical protein